MQNLLLEIGTEELPSSYIEPAIKQFLTLVNKNLPMLADFEPVTLATPRRLVFFWEGLMEQQASETKELKGPPRNACFDKDGNPTKALTGFLSRSNVQVENVRFVEIKGREYAYIDVTEEGKKTTELFPPAVQAALTKLTFPKNMVWNDPSQTFARPVRWILCKFGAETISFEWNGVTSSGFTYGHKMLDSSTIQITEANLDSYLSILKSKQVVVSHLERKAQLKSTLESIADDAGFAFRNDEKLLAELNYQLECPNAIIGKLDDKYLELPEPVLATTLSHHQYAFLVLDKQGNPAPAFLAACNVPGDQKHLEQVVRGNENVCRARLEDALFFFREDLHKPLRTRVDELKGVVFHPRLGSNFDKIARIQNIISYIGAENCIEDAVRDNACEAAVLARVDQVTSMVFELPELQGTMGRIYAAENGEKTEVCAAIEEMYMPVSSNGKLPLTPTGVLLSLADRIDTIAGFFAAGLKPTSSRDPFGLRRHAYAIIRILRENSVVSNIWDVFEKAVAGVSESIEGLQFANNAMADIGSFFTERVWNELLTEFPHDISSAVFAVKGEYSENSELNVADLFIRAAALSTIASREEFPLLCTTIERAANITKDFEQTSVPDAALAQEDAEKALFEAWVKGHSDVEKALTLGTVKGYADAATSYLELFSEPLNIFFDRVFVNAEDVKLRENRKSILKAIHMLIARDFADLSKVVVKK